jgi:P4 family phage/plasmid primase-like protien
MQKFKLQIDIQSYKTKPNRQEMRIIKPRTQDEKNIAECDLLELTQKINEGRTISPAVLVGGCSAENWQEQQLFMVDIDNNADTDTLKYLNIQVQKKWGKGEELKTLPEEIERIPIISLEDALFICRANKIEPSFYYYSFSHTEEKPKFRLCFVMDEVVRDTGKREIIIETLISLFRMPEVKRNYKGNEIKMFQQVDVGCKNADRLFLGTNKEVVILDYEKRVKMDSILGAYKPQEEPKQTEKERNSFYSRYDSSYSLDDLKKNFDFFSYLKTKNGEIAQSSSNYATFKNCGICGHHEDLVYFHSTNTYRCFHNNEGGTIIDYLMNAENMKQADATKFFIHNLCGIEEKAPKKPLSKAERLNTPEKIEERKARAERIEQNKLKPYDWYDVNEKFLPRLLGEYLAQTEQIFFMAESFYNYKSGCYRKMTDAEVFNKIKKCMRENAKPTDIQNVIEFWKSEVSKKIEEVNNNSKIISLKNTMLKIKDNGEIETLEHTPNFYNTVQLEVNYNPDAKCETFLKFLSEALTEENIKALQEIIGCLMTTETKLQKAFFFIGKGGCGKSTIIRVLQHILGTSNYSTLSLQDLSDKFRAFGLLGKIANFYADLPDRPLEDSSTFKSITGEDEITIERKFGQPIDGFRSKTKLLFSCNQMPRCKDRTDGLYRRLYFIPFNEPLPEQQRDGDLTNKLILEVDGIFNWALEGLKRVILREWKIFETEAHKEKLKEYIGDNDNVIPFINENCVIEKGLYIKSSVLYEEYKQYCIENGMKAFNSNNFFKSIEDNANVFKTNRCRKGWNGTSENNQWIEGVSTHSHAKAMDEEGRRIFSDIQKGKNNIVELKCSKTS